MTVLDDTSTVSGRAPRHLSPASVGTLLGDRPPPVTSAASQCFDVVRNLQAGWNGRSAHAPSPLAINRAVSLLEALWAEAVQLPNSITQGAVLVPQVFARPAGGVQFEWHAGDAHLEVSVDPDGEASIAAESASMRIDCDVEIDLHWPGRPPKPAVTVLGEIFNRVWAVRPLEG